MKVEMKMKNKQLARKRLLQFHFVSNQLKFHVVAQLVQEVDHAAEELAVVVLVVVVIVINLDVKDFKLQSYLYNHISFLAKSPNQQQSSHYQQTGEYQNDDQQPQQQQQQQSRPYRGGSGRSFF
jgi:hypothetical protein